ncbi:MAG: RecQ family ATP-dependent DNA helicase [Spirochaetaceae bacterium]|nr:RecQ family ATP-dependent DNA helicase [Spirochaetaceae bacterium]
MTDPVTAKCQSVFGIPYPYPWQRLIIAGVLDAVTTPMSEPLRQIAVLPTGAGKSLCWMLPAVLLEGLTIAVFPLLSLMSDQERRLTECGIKSVVLRGGQEKSERKKSWSMLKQGEVRIVLANPEVLQSPEVENRLEKLHPTFLVVDETHTVSQWGESFRPACAEMGRLVKAWKPPAVLALTATAGPYMRERIKELLFNGETPTEALADPDRPAIRYGVYPSLSRSHALDRLIRDLPRPAIVFGSTRPSVEQAAGMLRRRLKDDEVRYYHAGLSREEKNRLENWFLSSEDGILCATCAYGMGVDKKNIRTVIHLSPPSSVEAYLQESGRASRDGNGASAWLITTPEDCAVLDDLRGGAPHAATEAEVVARARQAVMRQFVSSTGRCRREMLLESLGIEAQDCTGCDVCGGEAWERPPEEDSIRRVARWNRGRFRKGQLARILIGRRNVEIRRAGLDMVRGFGMLSGWELEDTEEAIGVMIRTKKLKYSGLGRRGKGLKAVPGAERPLNCAGRGLNLP